MYLEIKVKTSYNFEQIEYKIIIIATSSTTTSITVFTFSTL
jgi:hypothetical protein